MQEDPTFHCQSECGVFVVLPEPGVSEFPPLLPLVAKPQSPAAAGCPTSSPLSYISSSPASTSSRDTGPGRHEHDAFYPNTKQSHETKFTSQNVPVSRHQKVSMWHDAILRKRELVLQILQAQKVIEEVENEAAQYLTRDTIARIHRKYYNLDGGNTCDGIFISAISALKIKG